VTKSDGSFELTFSALLNLIESRKKEVENFVEKLVSLKWLILKAPPVEGMTCSLALSLRCIYELRQYLKNEFPESIFDCSICKDIVLSVYSI
jgi:hypothetical protein